MVFLVSLFSVHEGIFKHFMDLQKFLLKQVLLHEGNILLLKLVVEDLIFVLQVDDAELELVDFDAEFFGHCE